MTIAGISELKYSRVVIKMLMTVRVIINIIII